ncbi:LysR family transcriptional regulator [Denitrobaculum tricleocarpae]|uniref:LysR family transcriptional regulator n=1 Tax=Denitrobaculum tricleocarpae TaxID=2591009 RepID=A0A545TYB3_9PROT|nr:LysR family transcriptional regulator [Denitrobaculum tricleocarpae]TQV82216.1 LysR family transcriptional regulator [Denitrobaculum tricleocarpae]
MELSELRIFMAVVREGGITRAAERLNRVQSNVTTRIRQLEERLETRLFDRRGKKLVLTAAGQTLLDYADRLLALAAEAEAALADDKPRGVFRLGAMESTAAIRLPEPLARYSRLYPEVTMEMRTGNPAQLANALLAGEIEAAFVAEPVAEARFDSVPAFVEEPVIVTSQDHPPIGKTKRVPDTMIVFEQGCPHRRRLEAWYAQRGSLPERTVELGSYHAMLGCVSAGMGAALVPRSVISTFPEGTRLRITTLPKGQNRIRTLMIWPKDSRSPKVEALRELLATD